MRSILEKFDLLTEQSGAATGTRLNCGGDILKSISPIEGYRRRTRSRVRSVEGLYAAPDLCHQLV